MLTINADGRRSDLQSVIIINKKFNYLFFGHLIYNKYIFNRYNITFNDIKKQKGHIITNIA